MNIAYYKEYSQCLERDMEFKVYGHAGRPILVFPSQDGRFYDFEDQGMVDTISSFIENGDCQLFCVDSVDQEGWSDSHLPYEHRTYIIEQYYFYIVNELVPRIFEINANGGDYADGIYTTGVSLGASHAVNFMFRNPDVFKGCIGLSGYYDCDIFFGNYCDDILYRNSPIRYLNGMNYDHPYVQKYRECRIVLCCGQGAWEDEMVKSTGRMQELLNAKDIPAWCDFWGYDVSHDWPWWRIQFPYFMEHILFDD